MHCRAFTRNSSIRQQETIQSLHTAHELLTSLLDSPRDRQQTHDNYLSSQSLHAGRHDQHIKLLTSK